MPKHGEEEKAILWWRTDQLIPSSQRLKGEECDDWQDSRLISSVGRAPDFKQEVTGSSSVPGTLFPP